MAKPVVSEEVRLLCFTRANFQCERCYGTENAPGFSLHHRRPRMMGGSFDARLHQPAWLILLCGSGVTGCHGWVESNRNLSRELGFLLYGIDDGQKVPFQDIGGYRWLLDNLGQKALFVTSNITEVD